MLQMIAYREEITLVLLAIAHKLPLQTWHDCGKFSPVQFGE